MGVTRLFRSCHLLGASLACTLVLTGCASQHHETMETEIRVLKAQLAQQEDALVQQSQALEQLRALQDERSSEDQALIEDLQGLVASLSQLRREAQERQLRESDCPVIEPVTAANGRYCTDRVIIGELEHIHLQPPDAYKEARIDTGATTSSLDARDIQTFERDGEDYVRFILPDREAIAERDEDDEDADNADIPGEEMEMPVVRFARIVQSSAEDEDRRPVVELQYRLGSVERVGEFTLTDRAHLTYGTLVGRNILRDLFVVDVGQKHSTSISQTIEDGDVPGQEDTTADENGEEDDTDEETED